MKAIFVFLFSLLLITPIFSGATSKGTGIGPYPPPEVISVDPSPLASSINILKIEDQEVIDQWVIGDVNRPLGAIGDPI